MKDNAIEHWMVYLLIHGSNQAKYETLTEGFVSQYSLGNDQYPRSITTSTDALSNCKIDPQYYDNQKRNHYKSRINCKNRDTDNEGNPKSFSQQELTWYCRGKKGHTSIYCDKWSTTPCAECACNKAMQHLQDEEDVDTADSNNVSKLSAGDRLMHSTVSTSSRNRRIGNSNRRNQYRSQGNEKPRPSWYQHFQQLETHISGTPVTDDIVNNHSGKFGSLKDVIILNT